MFRVFRQFLQVIMVFKPEEVFWPPEIDDLVIAPSRGQVRLQQGAIRISLRPHTSMYPCHVASARDAVAGLCGPAFCPVPQACPDGV